MKRINRKRALVALSCVCALAITAGAIAYFTSTGSGTGTAKVGSTQAVTLHATTAGELYPGASQTVTFTVDNPSPGAQRVGTITLASITADAGHSSCLTTVGGGSADFSMAPVLVNKTFPSGNGQSAEKTGTLVMNDTGISQNGCQGATLTLNLTSN